MFIRLVPAPTGPKPVKLGLWCVCNVVVCKVMCLTDDVGGNLLLSLWPCDVGKMMVNSVMFVPSGRNEIKVAGQIMSLLSDARVIMVYRGDGCFQCYKRNQSFWPNHVSVVSFILQ